MTVTLAVSAKPTRSSYVDTLRALAIVRVYVHHTLWISWLTTLFPSMWVMFALAGLFTARSIDSRGGRDTVRARFRRTLPPLWGLALVVVPLMLLEGWARDRTSPLSWPDLVYWIIPLANPPTSSWAGAFALALWYLRAYLWFVLLSPMMLWAFRRWPVPTLVAPLLAAMVLNLPWITLPPSKIGDVIGTVTIYGTAWMFGFARLGGQLDRLSARACGLLAAALGAAGLAWGLVFGSEDGWPFTNQVAEALWGTGFVLVLLRWHPSMDWLKHRPAVAKTVSYLNSRAVTIYVWHLPVLLATGTLLAMAGVSTAGMAGRFAALTFGVVLLAVTVLATGWIEDLAARRRVALPMLRNVRLPRPRTEATPSTSAPAAAAPALAAALAAQLAATPRRGIPLPQPATTPAPATGLTAAGVPMRAGVKPGVPQPSPAPNDREAAATRPHGARPPAAHPGKPGAPAPAVRRRPATEGAVS
jgi:peptidoglycan/LPS O-acetylase OafA/YrhL